MESSNPTIIVCGLGRSGSSLLMRMLYAAKVPVFASEQVTFETMHSVKRVGRWIHHAEGMAVKILDPVKYGPYATKGSFLFIWCQRDFREQALSHLKTQKQLGLFIDNPRRRARQYQRQMKRETIQNIEMISKYPLLTVRFESLLSNPLKVATRIHTFLLPHFTADPAIMADQVVKRSPKNYEGFLEIRYKGDGPD